ncbi:MAG TPA: hypothetical protein VHW06_16920 [Streptosporangiaceae bacterium]|jgi:hypothetical protein|nr:hypothetical protein [Streptosporangiaceae bacterium]
MSRQLTLADDRLELVAAVGEDKLPRLVRLAPAGAAGRPDQLSWDPADGVLAARLPGTPAACLISLSA